MRVLVYGGRKFEDADFLCCACDDPRMQQQLVGAHLQAYAENPPDASSSETEGDE
jgi:hypothetical protein